MGKGKAGGRLIRAALKDLRKIKKRRRGSPGARPTKAAKPSRQASYAARREADRARAAGRTSGTSESVTTPDGRHTFSSTSGEGYPLHRRVQSSIDSMPPEHRAPWHGQCALPQSLSKALDQGVDPTGSAVGSARIHMGAGHGSHNLP